MYGLLLKSHYQGSGPGTIVAQGTRQAARQPRMPFQRALSAIQDARVIIPPVRAIPQCPPVVHAESSYLTICRTGVLLTSPICLALSHAMITNDK